MTKKISTDGYEFEFSDDVIDAFVFDSPEYKDSASSMKSVDIIAEFPKEYLFIELKKYDPARGGIEFRCPLWEDKKVIENCPLNSNERKRDSASIKRIAHDLRRQYCDTFLFRYAEEKIDKDVNFICVIEGCDSALTSRLSDIVSHSIAHGKHNHSLWKRSIVKNVAVVNTETWNISDQLNYYGHCSVLP